MIGWVIGGGVAAVVVAMLWWGRRLHRQSHSPAEARRQFVQQREHLEAKFLTAAAASGKPRGLRWADCEWDSSVEFARDRHSGLLTALVGVTIRFEAVEGSDMEGLPAVGNLRCASALFYHAGGRWQTAGRAVFNLTPDEVLARFDRQYERLPVGSLNPPATGR